MVAGKGDSLTSHLFMFVWHHTDSVEMLEILCAWKQHENRICWLKTQNGWILQRLMQQTVPLHCSRSVFDLCIVRLVGCRTLLNCSTTISVLMRTCESQHSVTIVDQLLVWRLHVEIYVDSWWHVAGSRLSSCVLFFFKDQTDVVPVSVYHLLSL